MIKICIINLIILVIAFAVSGSQDSSRIIIPDVKLKAESKSGDPFIIGGMSMLIPGTGQILSRHYFKAGTFVALEAITASMAGYRFNLAHQYRDLAEKYDLIAKLDTTMSNREKAIGARYNELESRYVGYNALSWMIGGYVFNVLDAINGTGIYKNSEYRSPVTAGWLAAVPGLGLGQIYNGSLSKAGMVIMAQVSLGVVAYDYHRLMRAAEINYSKSNESSGKNVLDNQYLNDWKSKRSSAFQKRNTYLWYSVFFYLYGILDAVVDAHLHDYQEKMKLSPDIVPGNGGAQLNLNVNF